MTEQEQTLHLLNALMICIQPLISFPLEIWKESQVNWDKAKGGRSEES